MKRILLIIFSLMFFSANALSLKGGVSEEYIPNAFFGSWGVISKLNTASNPMMFNPQSRDIWTLSGYSNILILQNPQSGAYSEIIIKEKNKDGKTLKFQREKNVEENGTKIKYKEQVSFVLMGNTFSGTDKFIVEKYDKNNTLIKKDEATYLIEGVKIPAN
ncbi:hypothetical protein IJX73_06025 [bacterium]|nr:hypothetical protein [bacterium]